MVIGFILFVLCAVACAACSIILRSLRNGITPMPSSKRARQMMVKTAGDVMSQLRALGPGRPDLGCEQDIWGVAGARQCQVFSSEVPVVIEAGSGWGGVAFALAKRLPGAHIIGYENSLIPFLVARLRLGVGRALSTSGLVGLPGYANLEFCYCDFQEADITKAALVLCYLHPAGMQKIADGLKGPGRRGSELDDHGDTGSGINGGVGNDKGVDSVAEKPDRAVFHGPIIISNTFRLPGKRPQHVLQSGDLALSPIYVYVPGFSW